MPSPKRQFLRNHVLDDAHDDRQHDVADTPTGGAAEHAPTRNHTRVRSPAQLCAENLATDAAAQYASDAVAYPSPTVQYGWRYSASMQFNLTQDFPAGLDRLWVAFGRADYPQRKYVALGATAVRVRRFRATRTVIEVELERDVPVDKSLLPPWMRLLARSKQTLQHRTAWRRIGPSQAAAELDIVPVGLPVRAHASGTIVESASGRTRMELIWQVDSTLGARVERQFADQIKAALDDDHTFTLQYLDQAAVR